MPAQTVSISSGALARVDQAAHTMRKIEEYISAGMETAIDVGLDLADHKSEKGDEQLDQVRDIMLQYAGMEREYNQFLEAVKFVREQAVEGQCKDGELEALLDAKLQELQKDNRDEDLNNHDKYKELEEKVYQTLHPEEGLPSTNQGMSVAEEDGDVALTQQEVNTKCPYTAKEMVNPVQNKLCGHNYEKDAIITFINQKGPRARCPVGGCKNEQPLHEDQLVEDRELKQYIDLKKRKAGGGRGKR